MSGRVTRRWFGFGVGRSFVYLIMAMFLAACSGDACSSCDCEGFVQQDFPPEHYNKTIQQAGQIRVTGAGLDFVEQNLPTIVEGALPTGLAFCIPETDSNGIRVCYDGEMCQGAPGCELTLSIDDAQVEPQPTDTLNIQVIIGDLNETLSLDPPLANNCTLTLHKDGDQNQPGTITASVPVTFTVDEQSPTRDVRISLGEIDANLDDLGFDIDGPFLSGCNLVDAAAGIGFVQDLLKDQLRSQLDGAIESFGIEEQLCRTCDASTPCGVNSTCDESGDVGICRYTDGQCVPRPLGVEGQLQLGAVLGDVSQHPDASVDLLAKVADTATVNTGVTLGLRSGFEPDSYRRCVPVDPTQRPSFDQVALSPSITGEMHPVTGQPFHIGIGYHERPLEQLFWSMWASGVTCLEVDSSFSDLLNTGTLSTFLPSLRKLGEGGRAAKIQIVPQRPPVVQLGSNTVTPMDMTYQIDEGLITLDWKDLDIHIYAHIQERWTRITTLRSDLLLPIAIVPDGSGAIIPVLGDFEAAIQNIRPVAPELLAEDPQVLIDLVPTLLGFALPSLTGDLISPIEIPEFVGLRIDIDQEDITSVDNNTMIAIFANFEVVMMPVQSRVNMLVGGYEVDTSRWTKGGLVKPSVKLDVLPLLPPMSFDRDLPVEYQYRVDEGIWSLFEVADGELEIDDPLFLLQGDHKIEVRARYRGVPESTTASPVETTVRIDYTAPEVEIDRDGQTLAFVANDIVDHASELSYRYRVVTKDGSSDGAWSAWTNKDKLDVSALGITGPYRVDVEARDLSGHVGTATANFRGESKPEPVATLPSDGTTLGGCSSGGSGGPAGLLFLIAFAALLFAWRRRPRGILIGIAAVLAMSGCDCSDDGTATCAEECPTGTACVSGTCEPAACAGDEECPAGFFCSEDGTCAEETCEQTCSATCDSGQFGVCSESGECSCENYCDKGCGDEEYCCFESNSCESLPDPCADEVCDPGYEPVPQDPSTADSPTCEATVGTCACEALPPVDIGWHGEYASIDVGGGVTATAVYNSTYRDLMVGILDGNLEPTWYWVDGIDLDGPVVGDPNGPRFGIIVRGDDMGKYTDIVVDDSGTIHVFYQDGEEDDLKYARGDADGNFETTTLDAEGATGYWNSALLHDGELHVVYTAQVSGGPGNWGSEIRTLSFDPAADLSSLAPTPTVLDSTASNNPCGFDCGNDHCFVAEGECLDNTRDCEPECGEGEQCLDGACLEVYSAPPPAYAEATGQFNDLTPTPGGGMLLTFYNGFVGNVFSMEYTGDMWSAPNAIATAPAGPYVDGVIADDGTRHFAYMNPSGPSLVYTLDGGTPEEITDGVRDRAEGWIVTDIGEDVTLRVNSDGTVTALYQDATTHTLYQADRATDGTWTVTEVAGYTDPYTGGRGFHTEILPMTDTSLAVEFVINQQVEPTEGYPVYFAP